MPPAIDVANLRKTYRDGLWSRRDVTALDGVSIAVQPGEIFGLLGPNGAGKTTLIKILLGIVRKSAGTAQVLGAPAGARAMRRHVGYLPENHLIPRHLTANTALEFYGGLSGMPLGEVRRARPALLELVGLQKWGTTPVSKYSKGMQQRLGLAQAILHNPQLVILDEPTDGVDPVGRAEIRIVLKRLQSEGKTIFLNSHLLQEVELVSDRVAILDRGQVKRVAGVRQLTDDATEVVFELSGESDAIRRALPAEMVRDRQPRDGAWVVSVKTAESDRVDHFVDRLRAEGVSIRALTTRRNSLEEAFLRIIQSGESA